MDKVTLEKVDTVKNKANISYADAKKVLEIYDYNVVDTLVYLENQEPSIKVFLNYIKRLVEKGNVNRIKIKKEDNIIVDIPVNAGIAVGVLGIIYPSLIGIMGVGTIAGAFAKLAIEITKPDGSVEIINKNIEDRTKTVKEKASDIAEDIILKYEEHKNKSNEKRDESIYRYTVNFDDVDSDNDDNN